MSQCVCVWGVGVGVRPADADEVLQARKGEAEGHSGRQDLVSGRAWVPPEDTIMTACVARADKPQSLWHVCLPLTVRATEGCWWYAKPNFLTSILQKGSCLWPLKTSSPRAHLSHHNRTEPAEP